MSEWLWLFVGIPVGAALLFVGLWWMLMTRKF